MPPIILRPARFRVTFRFAAFFFFFLPRPRSARILRPQAFAAAEPFFSLLLFFFFFFFLGILLYLSVSLLLQRIGQDHVYVRGRRQVATRLPDGDYIIRIEYHK